MYLDSVTLAVSDLTADARRLSDALALTVDNGSIRLGPSHIDLKTVEHPPGWWAFALRRDPPPGMDATAPHPLGAVGISAVALAVHDLDAHVPSYEALIGHAPHRDSVAFVQARRVNWQLEDGSILRLLTPEQPGIGTVAEHLALRGEGVFIVRLAVRDLGHAVAELGRRGTLVSDTQPDGTVFLLDPGVTLGARFALVESS